MQAESTNHEPVSNATLYVLYAAGLSLLLVFGGVLWAAVSAFGSVLARVKRAIKSRPKPKASAVRQEVSKEPAVHAPSKARGPDLKSLIKDSEKATRKQATKEDTAAAHELWINTLKGHADVVHGIAWSRDATHLATACEDMYCRIFDLGDVASKEPKFKRIKTPKIPVGVGFGESKDSVVAAMRGVPDTQVALFEMMAKPNEVASYQAKWQVDHVHGKETCLAMCSVPPESALGGAGLVFSLSAKKELKVLSMAGGRELASVEPASLANHDLVVSQDARFVAVPSFTADLKLWEVKYDRERLFKGVSKVMDLKGHRQQIMTAAISPDNKRAVTVSKDLTMRIWNIDVRYGLSEDPKCTQIVPVPLPGGKVYQRMAFGPHGVIAASHETQVHFLSATSGELLERIDAHDGTITAMRWSPAPVRLPGRAPGYVLATSSKDKRVRIWRSPAPQ